MTLVTVHTNEQPSFLAAKAEVFTGEARKVKLDGLFVFRLLHDKRPVELVVQWIAHRVWANPFWHGLKVAV